eukprot:scaffold625_cov324-Pavlova_lutheri.AAC.118
MIRVRIAADDLAVGGTTPHQSLHRCVLAPAPTLLHHRAVPRMHHGRPKPVHQHGQDALGALLERPGFRHGSLSAAAWSELGRAVGKPWAGWEKKAPHPGFPFPIVPGPSKGRGWIQWDPPLNRGGSVATGVLPS